LLQDSLEDSLTAHNYNTLTASGGIEAISLYAQHRFEISAVLVDIMMASLDGVTTIWVFKAINAQVVIVAMSGLPCCDIGHFMNGININDFLLKPFTIQEFLQVIQGIN